MELSDELLEQIGAYLSGQLSASQQEQFEARLQDNPALRQEVALQRELKQGISWLAQKDRFRQMHADLDRRGLLTDIDGMTQPQPAVQEPIRIERPPVVRPLFRYGWASWAMAASFVLLLGIGWTLYQNQMEKRETLAQNERLFSNFFAQTPKSAPVLLPDPDRAAAPLPTQAADSVRLYRVLSDLERAELRPVIGELKSLAAGSPGHWSATAQWYLALAYVRNNQRTEAQQQLQEITRQNGHPYQPEARQLLYQLANPAPSRP